MNKFSTRAQPLLGTYVEIGTSNSQKSLSAVGEAFKKIKMIQTLMSFHDPDSDLSRLNCSDGNEILLHPLTLRVLRIAKQFTLHSGGLFNCTLGGKLQRLGVLPNHTKVGFLDYGDVEDLQIYERSARLQRRIQIVLDGIAKGFAVDLAVSSLKRDGIKSGWVNAGGDIRVFGDVTIPVYRRDNGDGFASLGRFKNCSIATSSVVEKYNDMYPGLIVAGNVGRPVTGNWTILATTAWRADALTKIAALASEGTRLETIARLKGKLVIPPKCSLGS